MRSIVLVVVLVIGCGSPGDQATQSAPARAGNSTPPDRMSSGGPSAGADGPRAIAGSGGSGGAGATGRVTRSGDAPPCDVQALLQTACQGCHASEPGTLAPMALVTQQDFDARSVSDPGRSVRELAALRIHDRQRPMPPPTSRRLTAEELELLDAYLADPNGTTSCAPPQDGGVAPLDDVGECYRFQAHDRPLPGDTTPFQAPNGEYYACFYFAVPWPDGSQAIQMRSLHTGITHHWQLYRTAEAFVDGAVTPSAPNCGVDDRSVLGVYSRSEQREQRMPADVGLVLPPPEHGILLEVHYYNPNDTVGDSTGVEVCTAARPRPNAADVTVLGVPLFALPAGQRTTIEGTCAPAYSGPIHVFRSFPHMHARGVAMDSTIVRADGRREALLDAAFDFNNQRLIDTAAVLQLGDQLVTRCHYQNDTEAPIVSGFKTDEEMCNLFVYAWPAGALSSAIFNAVPGVCVW